MNIDQNNNQSESGLQNRPEQGSTETNQQKEEPQTQAEPFGPVVYAYTRAQAIADGVHNDVSAVAREMGIQFPVYITYGVLVSYVVVPDGVEGQDAAGRLWDILWMLRDAIVRTAGQSHRAIFTLYVRNDNQKAKLVKLIAECGPNDFDDPSPAITVMLPEEDC